MDVIETRIDTNSDEYKRNFEAMELLVADLKEELRKAREERPQKDVDRLKKQGKLPVRTKLDMLLDRNTPFLEIAPLAARGMYDGKVHAAGLVAGIGIVEGHEVLVVASDAMIKGGAVYP
ncbi:MAG TPA: carboxyl transferase domain-containing protein, partial [Deltaproteobacteria bacterium]|nr:carboxyl transferase domain-containing protein [Deltaproteobacteria bacterium]HPR04089.1 carboxyl transferase domain-containing protein [Deltaproteobacteria bacterium]